MIGRWFERIRDELDAVVERDPAARNRLEVALLYPGVHAVWSHRVSHALWRRGAKFPARALSQATRALTNVEIHPGAQLGPRLFIDHAAGVVIGETAIVGEDVTIYHGVTLGGTTLDPVHRHPRIGDRVTIGAGAKVLGAIEVGDDSKIGANAVLVKSVEPGSAVVGVPGQVVAPYKESLALPEVNLHEASDDAAEPDPVAFAVRSLLRRVERLEAEGTGTAEPRLHREDGVWEIDDYAI